MGVDIGRDQNDRDGCGDEAFRQGECRGVAGADFDDGDADFRPAGPQLLGFGGCAREEGLPDAERFEHALDIERDQEFSLDNEGSLACKHVTPYAFGHSCDATGATVI